MRFLVDRCAGRQLARWLTETGHDVVDLSDAPADPGDAILLARSAEEGRILVTIDTDFGRLVFHHGAVHAGLIRLPDVPPEGRMTLMQRILDQHSDALERRAVVTVRGDRIRISESD
jgi:predicted nuclease of predicted toxin-antitoxin system